MRGERSSSIPAPGSMVIRSKLFPGDRIRPKGPMTISKTGKLSRSQGGFTLFELLVAIAIAVLAMGVVISRMGRMLDWELKNSSRKLASTIRYLYNKSASENVTLRLVLDIGESTYWVESTPDAYALVPEAEETTPKERPAPEEEPAEGEIQTIQPKEAVFGPTESFLQKKSSC